MKTLRNITPILCTCLLLGVAKLQARAQSYNILHTFGTNVMGQTPYAALIQGPDGKLYGTTAGGGAANGGQVFMMNPDGTGYTALKDFIGVDGLSPEAGLVLSGTTLFGKTVGGGANDSGVIFKLNNDGSDFDVLKEFSDSMDGVNPYGTLVRSDSTLYGTTEQGGAFGAGTVFKVGVDGTGFTVLKHFTGDDGGSPHGTLVLSGSTLYGTTVQGGGMGNGTVFKINTDGSGFTVLREFSDGAMAGRMIYGGLLLADGMLYGTTSSGGTFDNGTLFKMNPDGTGFAVLKNFNSTEANEQKSALVMLGTTLYGLSSHGGSNDWGAIFKINTDGSDFAVLREFGEGDGIHPYGSLLVSGTTLYATTSEGGSFGYGTVFKIESDGSGYTALTHFMGGDGASPDGLVVSGMSLYGTTSGGGASGQGTLFTIKSDGVGYAVLKDLTNSVDGQNPNGRPLVSGTNVYGTAAYGGSSGMGSIFVLHADGSGYTLLKEFTDSMEGTTPKGSLVRAGATLYGVAGEGGISNCGAVFQINTDGSGFTVLKHFSGSDGRSPSAGLVLAGTTLYGATYFGGSNNLGTVFKINTDGSGFAVLKEFSGAGVDGANPNSLVLDGAALYGTAQGGGPHFQNVGAVFKINTDGSAYTVLKGFFGYDDGSAPRGLVLSDSILYGVGGGGIFGGGTVFQIHTDGSGFAVIKHLGGDASFGESEPSDLALLGTTLYGTAVYGGNTGGGVLFSLSPGLPMIVIQPEPRLFFPVGGDTDFQVKATGLPAPGYRWYFNGTNALAGATNSQLMLTNVLLEQSGDYTVVVSNSFGSVTSQVARLDVVVLPPYIITQPTDRVTNLGATVQFKVLASGTAPLAYQWFKDGSTLSESGRIAGAYSATLTITNVFGGDAGGYHVVITNSSGSLTSLVAVLALNLVNVDGFDPQANGRVFALAVQADRKILVGGEFTMLEGAARQYLGRLNADGTLDTSFSAQISGSGYTAVNCLTVQPDGKILVGGGFTTLGGRTRTNIGRLNANGTLDLAFNPGANGDVLSLALQADGRVLVGGDFTTLGGQSRTNIGRLNADGSIDSSFNPAANAWVRSVATQPDGKILVGGYFTNLGGVAANRLGRLNADGSTDLDFNPGPNQGVFSLALQPDGKILVGGYSGITRLNTNGSTDPTFSPPEIGDVSAVIVRASGKIWLGGAFEGFLQRLNPDGSPDDTAPVKANAWVHCLARQSDHELVVGGSFMMLGGMQHPYVGRLVEHDAPAVLSSTEARTAEQESTCNLILQVAGTPPLSCQWYFNYTNVLAGSTNISLVLRDVQAAHSGAYTLVISNAAGIVASAPVMLNVIPTVERRPVPAINLRGEAVGLLNLEYASELGAALVWLPLDTVSLVSTSEVYFDRTSPLPPQRFYRAWQTGTPSVAPTLRFPYMVPALTLTGNPGNQIRVDGINQIGPIDAWFTLDTVTLTNTSQLYFDVTAPGQPPRLYRLMPLP